MSEVKDEVVVVCREERGRPGERGREGEREGREKAPISQLTHWFEYHLNTFTGGGGT